MKALYAAFFLFIIVAPAALADGLPDYKPSDVCAKVIEDVCWQAQLQAKAAIARDAPDPKLLSYCVADAAYRGPSRGARQSGYTSIFTCIERERWQEQLKMIDQKLGPPDRTVVFQYCDAAVPGNKEGACILIELLAELQLHTGDHDPLTPDLLTRCLSGVSDYAGFVDCIRR